MQGPWPRITYSSSVTEEDKKRFPTKADFEMKPLKPAKVRAADVRAGVYAAHPHTMLPFVPLSHRRPEPCAPVPQSYYEACPLRTARW